jgi:hypothetical protein
MCHQFQSFNPFNLSLRADPSFGGIFCRLFLSFSVLHGGPGEDEGGVERLNSLPGVSKWLSLIV